MIRCISVIRLSSDLNVKSKVYIETSIPSYYCEIREDTESIARKLLTREWWDNHR